MTCQRCQISSRENSIAVSADHPYNEVILRPSLVFILMGMLLACQAPSGFLPAPSGVPTGPLPGPVVGSGSQTISQGGMGATEDEGDSDTSVTSDGPGAIDGGYTPTQPSTDSTGSPMMDTPPIAGPSDQKNPKSPIPVSDKDRLCLSSFEIEKETLVISGDGSPPESNLILSSKALGSSGEVIDLYLWKNTADGMEAVEFPSDLIQREDLDPVKTGLQILTETDTARAGRLVFTFMGSQSGSYRFTAVGSLCQGGGSLVVMRRVVSGDMPPPEKKVKQVEEPSSEKGLDKTTINIINQFYEQQYGKKKTGTMYQMKGTGDGGIPAADTSDIPSKDEASRSHDTTVRQDVSCEQREAADKLHRDFCGDGHSPSPNADTTKMMIDLYRSQQGRKIFYLNK